MAAALTGKRHHAGSLLGGEATISLLSRLAEAEGAHEKHPSNHVLRTAVEKLRGDVKRRMDNGGMSSGEAMKTLYARAKEAILAASAGNSWAPQPASFSNTP